MSLYPSLEDMKVDRLIQAQSMVENGPYYNVNVPAVAPSYASAPPPDYASVPTLPYPVNPRESALYPHLGEFMGLELSPAVIAANMPEYLPENQVAIKPDLSVEATSNIGGLIAPISGQNAAIQRAHVTNGIREVILCKGAEGKIGVRLQAVNNGIFVCLVMKDTPAAMAGVRFGDQVLQIMGKDVLGKSPSELHDQLKKGPDSGISFILRDRPMERNLVLHKDSYGQIGFSFKNGNIVNIVLDSSAARNGLLTQHQLLEINGQNVIGLKDKEITQIILNAGDIVSVTVIPAFIYEHMTKKMASSIFGSMDHSVW